MTDPWVEPDIARRAEILEAARRRFEHYGYEKTTMAEIAADAGIAVGTLYLHFKSKADLLDTFGRECQGKYLDSLRRLARSKLGPTQRLRELARLRVLAIKQQMEATPHGGEVLLGMMQRGDPCCRAMRERERELIEKILREGVGRGEFSVSDPAETARVFQSAFSGFMPPACLGRPSEELTREIEALFDLILRALQAGPGTSLTRRRQPTGASRQTSPSAGRPGAALRGAAGGGRQAAAATRAGSARGGRS